MSTENQRYSPRAQAASIASFAKARGYHIVKTYYDSGISGLSIKNRKALQAMLAEVLSGNADYETILVFDISRWGRFQNPDQSAHYEFVCREAGVRVEYCAELFDNDDSPSSNLLKTVRRVMAAEFSRDLSARIARAHDRLASLGYWHGGSAGYGLRRQAISASGTPGPVLQHGQFKGIKSDHTVLVAGPPSEVATVLRIFRLYVDRDLTLKGIAAKLNREGVAAGEQGETWSAVKVGELLSARKYIGELEYQKTSGGLGQGRARRLREDWKRVPGAFEGIVPKALFHRAQLARADRAIKLSTEDMLAALRRVHDQHGTVTHKILKETPGLPRPQSFVHRFGSMAAACAAIGKPRGDEPKRTRSPIGTAVLLERLKALYERAGRLDSFLIDSDPSLPTCRTMSRRFGGLANAYALVGYVALDRNDLSSPIGCARAAALAYRRERLAAMLAAERPKQGQV